LLVATLPVIMDGSARLCAQDHAAATLAPPLGKRDGCLDFRQTASEVSARARGVDPWPGATASIEGETAKLFQPTVIAGSGAPGEFLGLVPEGAAVACAEGAVAFAEVQMPSRKRMPAKALLAGHPIRPGAVFG
jgi:methionyl-tRNA formyltransferase